jgi:hypothetical protein
MPGTQDGTQPESCMNMLDQLIKEHYNELKKQVGQEARIGDFIKMIELRRKLAPADVDQREFWSMLEKIRQDTLRPKKPRKTKTRKSAKE